MVNLNLNVGGCIENVLLSNVWLLGDVFSSLETFYFNKIIKYYFSEEKAFFFNHSSLREAMLLLYDYVKKL